MSSLVKPITSVTLLLSLIFFFFFACTMCRIFFVLATLELHWRVVRGARRQRVRCGTGFSVRKILLRGRSSSHNIVFIYIFTTTRLSRPHGSSISFARNGREPSLFVANVLPARRMCSTVLVHFYYHPSNLLSPFWSLIVNAAKMIAWHYSRDAVCSIVDRKKQ